MYRNLLLLLSFLSASIFSFGQNGTIKGVVVDDMTGETIIGVNIMYAPGKGAISDVNGEFEFNLPYGDYELTFSYVGYDQFVQAVKLNKDEIFLKVKLENTTLKEVEIVADVAKSRETPVAFSTIKPAKLDEELASQDIPMVLNSTPGVYATQQGGGDGDARINIRGFNQRNIAVMLDGIPVNDMENGWVYWSNWFGLDMVTRSIQVQRGLGASKLALPSVGGTMNIITKGIESKKGMKIKQEIGNDGFMRTSIGITTGRMKGGWGVTFAGSYKQGDGWVDQTWTRGGFLYLKVDKKLGDHLISFSAMGAPQEHGQRSYKKPITMYDTDYADKIGMDPATDYITG
ncbi:MAG: TonB-dependent receptor, partial [Bacteroidetes bacterium]